ncbi:segregation and condensation protein A [Paraferrimonas sedimenticola]|uniref:Segregation and condensation protein A n=1 Tax=Paraferrimonas sedimenticola TaxID=375674 RepID=A0AA37RR64_9GAMM|nr:ScpA family protein [Paraferrimonas sedimenticola]GLP94921.1 segregation and condensation protein A [Paraferrimonas sedimenticola]
MQQVELIATPVAKVEGEPVRELPADLFIPPEALEVFLETFEGPLDFLLYLIRKQKLDIVDLPIHRITTQYLEYIGMLQGMKVELAADYLVMAATLAEIKSRMLLPKPELDDEEQDPRALLVAQLQAYEVVKQAASDLDDLPRLERDRLTAAAKRQGEQGPKVLPPQVELGELLAAFAQVCQRLGQLEHHKISRESLSTRERMSQILSQLECGEFVAFERFFSLNEGKAGVLVSLLALLELLKGGLIELMQAKPFAQIHVRLAS